MENLFQSSRVTDEDAQKIFGELALQALNQLADMFLADLSDLRKEVGDPGSTDFHPELELLDHLQRKFRLLIEYQYQSHFPVYQLTRHLILKSPAGS